MFRTSAQRFLWAVLILLSLVAAACGSTTVTADAPADGAASSELGEDLPQDDVGPEEQDAPSEEEATTASEPTATTPEATGSEATESTVAPTTSTTTTSTTTTSTTTTSTTTTTTTTTAAPTGPVSAAVACAAQVPLQQRVGQLMFPVMVQSEFAVASDLASQGLLGGVVLLGQPTAAVANDISTYQSRSLYGPGIIAVDEEGGRVQRLSGLTSALPSAGTVGSTFSLDEAHQLAEDHARAIGELGFTMNLAPVVDLNNGSFIGDRSFGADPELVTNFAFASAEGIIDAGLDPVLKHFPGHGRGIDSHTGLPTIPGVDVLRGSDLVPFAAAAERDDLPIMIGHLVVEGLTGDQPASVSNAAVNGLLRDELGFDGLVMTDAFNMDAIAATLNNAQAAELSIAAGVDLVMLGSLAATRDTVNFVVDAVNDGRIDELTISESFVRIMETRGIDPCGLPFE